MKRQARGEVVWKDSEGVEKGRAGPLFDLTLSLSWARRGDASLTELNNQRALVLCLADNEGFAQGVSSRTPIRDLPQGTLLLEILN